MDNKNLEQPDNGQARRLGKYFFLMPCTVILIAAAVYFMPALPFPQSAPNIRTMRVPGYPIVLTLEQHNGKVSSAWLRTPGGVREIPNVADMVFVSETKSYARVDQDNQDDLLWRLSFINFDGEGAHVWLGMTTWSPKVFISVTPYRYTRWDAVPAKLTVPVGTAIYVAPGIPLYDIRSEKIMGGRDAYSFVYTMRMTPDGPAFVPVPTVYKQLSVLLKAGIKGEFSPSRRLSYLRMLKEFDTLAQGGPPQAETILNLNMQKADTLQWKR